MCYTPGIMRLSDPVSRSKSAPGLLIAVLLLALAISWAPQARASAGAQGAVLDDQAVLSFPDAITFRAEIESQKPIVALELEYGTTELTCGTVVARAFPSFTPGTNVQAEWSWEMVQSGSLPPGATIWWRWRYSDGESIFETDRQTVTWLDAVHDWQVISSGPLNLHWYQGDQAFARELLAAAQDGLSRLQEDAGLEPTNPIHLYIYGNTSDMQAAILFEPSWTGGIAFPEHDIVIIGIAPGDLEWGRATIAHELTHVLVGHLTFSCLGDVPTWLNEGLAVYAEGELDPASAAQLEEAIRSDRLLSVRALSGGFSEVPSRAYLSYSQSYSLVKYLVEAYGQEQMDALLFALRDGAGIDQALRETYGFDVAGLEVEWRAAVGAPPRAPAGQPTAQATPTFVPTYVPFAGTSLLVTPTPFTVPSPSSPQPEAGDGIPARLLAVLLAAGGCLLLAGAAAGLGLYLAARRSRGGSHEAR